MHRNNGPKRINAGGCRDDIQGVHRICPDSNVGTRRRWWASRFSPAPTGTESTIFHAEKEPLYAKDAPCPPQWGKWLGPEVVPERTLPFGPDDIFWHLKPEVSQAATPTAVYFSI